MRVLCRQCRVELTPLNQHSHGFCIGCTGDNVSVATMLDEQYRRLDQDTGRRTWELLSSLAEEIHSMRVEMRILLEASVGVRKRRKKIKKKAA